MTGASGDDGNSAAAAAAAVADEELAQALMIQFRMDMEAELGEPIPADVAADPVKFDEYVRAKFDETVAQRPDQMNNLMSRTIENNSTLRSRQPQRAGLQGFLSRLKNGAVRTTTAPIVATSTRVKVVAVGAGGAGGRDDKRTSLLSDQDHNNEDRA